MRAAYWIEKTHLMDDDEYICSTCGYSSDRPYKVCSNCEKNMKKIKYDPSWAADEDELVLIEKWKDAEAIAVHGGQAHYARLGELKKEFVEKTDIERFETAE